MHTIDYLDIMIQYSCNLSCSGCITLTDYRRQGYVSADEGQQWLAEWKNLITPKTVCLFGGEPFMNPTLKDWIYNVRKNWPMAEIKINTNGFFLKKFSVVNDLIANSPSTLQISLHFRNDLNRKQIINNLVNQLRALNKNFKIIPTCISRPHEQFILVSENFKIVLAEFGDFIKPYQGHGKTMLPWQSSDIASSHANCGSPRNPILYKNKLYKCGPIANLKDTLTLFDIQDSQEWQYYINYHGLSSSDDLTNFVNSIGNPENICSMCSASKPDAAIDHYAPGAVTIKKGKV